MKQITLCITLLIFSTVSLCQQTTLSQTITKQDYLQKSKHQKKTAWILAGGGLLLEISGAIAYQHGNAGLLLFGAGLLSQATSIPFFISAGINKRKSKKASVSFKVEKTPDFQPATISSRSHSKVSFKLDL